MRENPIVGSYFHAIHAIRATIHQILRALRKFSSPLVFQICVICENLWITSLSCLRGPLRHLRGLRDWFFFGCGYAALRYPW